MSRLIIAAMFVVFLTPSLGWTQYHTVNNDGSEVELNHKPMSVVTADDLAESLEKFTNYSKYETLHMLATSKFLQDEFELVDYQKSEIKNANDKLDAMYKSFNDETNAAGSKEERAAVLKRRKKGVVQELNNYRSTASDALLPHQTKALDDFATKLAMTYFKSALPADELRWGITMKKAIGLNDEEAKVLEAEVAKIEEDMNKKITAAKREARESVLKKVPKEKRELLERLVKDTSIDYSGLIKKVYSLDEPSTSPDK